MSSSTSPLLEGGRSDKAGVMFDIDLRLNACQEGWMLDFDVPQKDFVVMCDL